MILGAPPSTPQVVRALADSNHTVVWAGCGREHTLVALASGGVYSWGWGEGGRLGLGEVDAVLSPRRVEEVRLRQQAVELGRRFFYICAKTMILIFFVCA